MRYLDIKDREAIEDELEMQLSFVGVSPIRNATLDFSPMLRYLVKYDERNGLYDARMQNLQSYGDGKSAFETSLEKDGLESFDEVVDWIMAVKEREYEYEHVLPEKEQETKKSKPVRKPEHEM